MRLKRAIKPVEDWIVKHPALFAGFVIYSYYLTTALNFFIDFLKRGRIQTLHFWDFVSQFDALPVMWILAYTFVRLLNLREKVHEEEKRIVKQQQQLEIQGAQFQTLRAVTLTLMDKINNPVAIILMYLRRLKRKSHLSADARADYDTIRKASERISKALKEASEMEEYRVLETPFGQFLDM